MNILKLTTSAVALTLTGSAFAADLPSRRAPAPYVAPVPLMTWTGFHVGINAGARFGGDSTATTIGVPTFTNPGVAAAVIPIQTGIDASFTNILGVGTRTGALLGVQAGYDFQYYNSFLIGFEADVQGNLSGGTRGLFGNVQGIGTPGFVAQSFGYVQKRQDWLGTARARLGYTVTPTFLLYATGGLAYGGVKSSTLISSSLQGPGNPGAVLPISGAFGSYSTNRVGYTVGAGAEFMFSPSFSLKAEYLYYDLGSTTYNGGVSNFSTAGLGLLSQDAVRTRVRFDGHIARVGVNYHFWSPVVAPVVARY